MSSTTHPAETLEQWTVGETGGEWSVCDEAGTEICRGRSEHDAIVLGMWEARMRHRPCRINGRD